MFRKLRDGETYLVKQDHHNDLSNQTRRGFFHPAEGTAVRQPAQPPVPARGQRRLLLPSLQEPVLRIRIRIHAFWGLLDPDPNPLVRGMDPDSDSDPSIINQK